jgi:hypothetical protein
MTIQDIVVQTEKGERVFRCTLKNVKEKIFQIVDEEGNNSPQSLEWNDGKSIKIFLFNGLRIDGQDVFTFTLFSQESHKIGTLGIADDEN